MTKEIQLVLSSRIENKIRELVSLINGPLYLYDTVKIQQNCRKLLDIRYTPKSIHFAMMANHNPRVLQIVKNMGLNVFVNSVIHLELALEQGFQNNQIIFAASAMDQPTMHCVASHGVRVILDSEGQLERWRRLFPTVGVGIRCNIGECVVPKNTLAGYFIGAESRLGMTVDEIECLSGDPCITGLHIYVGTNLVDIDYFLNCYRYVADLARAFPALRFLDLGGGFGLHEDPNEDLDWAAYGERVTALMEEVSHDLGRPIELILEPGRTIGGDAGYFVCRVTDVKYRGQRQLIGVNASSVQFPRPLFYPDTAFHPVGVLPQNRPINVSSRFTSSIYGCSTYSRDYLARDVPLPEVIDGDIVILGYAGSYCASSYTTFLGFPQVEEYFL